MVTGDDDEEMKVKVTIKKPPPKDPEVKIKIKKPPPKDAGPPASPTTLAIEAAFVQAASGMNGGNYEFSLMEFVRATRDAYDEGVMVPALNLELSTCQQYSAGRPLQADEIELRTVWLSLVYLTFERVGYESKRTGGFLGQSVAADLRQKFHTFTYDVVNAKKQGFDLAELKLEEVLQSDEERSPMEQAILSQAMRICYLAIRATEESSADCARDKGGSPTITRTMLLLASSHVASAFLAGSRPYGNARTAPVRMSVSGTVPEGTYSTVVFLRHGQSEWNEANLFTGWADVPLTTLGKNEAATGATAIWKEGIVFDVGYTSRLLRAKQTLEIVLQITGQEDLPVHRCWRLNERMYGALTGLNKKETVLKYGEDQVTQWRRSYDTPPPEIELDSPYAPHTDDKYCHIAEEDLPLSECLKDCVERTIPYWEGDITPALKRGKTVLIAAHGNSIRGMLKHIDGISDEEITGLEIPTGIPLVYHLDKELKPIKSPRATVPVLSGYFLADQSDLEAAQKKVADQTQVADG